MQLRLIIIFTAIHFSHTLAYTQSKQEKSLLKNARKHFTEENYKEAKKYYLELINLNGTNSRYLYETGLCFFNSEVEKEKSKEYFEKSLKTMMGKDTIGEVYYYLGRVNQYTNNFQEAIRYYNEFRRFIAKGKAGETLNREVKGFIEMCNNGVAELKRENNTTLIQNLGSKINTEYAEYAQIVKKDESVLLFTSRREGTTGGKMDNDSKYFEDIYVSKKINGEWSTPLQVDANDELVSSKINTEYHDAVIAYNKDENRLYIYRNKDIWQSELQNAKWTEPVRMNRNVNSKKQEPSVFVTPDEKTLFVVSNKNGGQGDRDIYISKKQEDGSWGPVINAGNVINTRFDEDAPFLASDGKTFYFSSKGHTSMGGYDIFKCEYLPDGTFTDPINLGIPINSGGDDIYYFINPETASAYLSSNRPGNIGDLDIFHVQLECLNIPSTEVRGIVVAGEKLIPTGATIHVKEKLTGNSAGTYTADNFTGKYTMVLKPDATYILEVVANGFEVSRPHTEEFTIPKQCEQYHLFQQINIQKIKNKDNKIYAQQATFQNALFNIKDSALNHFQINDIPEQGLNFNPVISPENKVSLSGVMMHNDIVPVKKTEIFLVNTQGEIVRKTYTDNTGFFNFNNLNPVEKYTVLINEDDLKISYYGDNKNNTESIVNVKGKLTWTNLDLKAEVDGAQVKITLINEEKKNVNFTRSDNKGNFKIDNQPKDPKIIAELDKAFSYPYKIDLTDIDQLYSAYIKTLDTKTNKFYTEVIDIIEIEQLITKFPEFENILFDFDKYFLRDKSKNVLDALTMFLKDNNRVTIELHGHCDWLGSDEYNMILSKKRANAAYDYLNKKGIEGSRMKKLWFGESKPAVANANPDGSDNPDNRQLNRRVEIKIALPGVADVVMSF